MKTIAANSAFWCVAQYKRGMADRATTNLLRQGFGVFSPTRILTRRAKGRFHNRAQPVFPGYVFIHVQDSADWGKIRSTFGISHLISFDNRGPARIPSGLVDELRERYRDKADNDNVQRFEAGQKVEVQIGPFSGAMAEIELAGANDRIWVLMDILGRKSLVETDGSNVLVLSGPTAA